MADPERFSNLPEYAFPRLRRLLADATPPAGVDPVVMTIGEPRHAILKLDVAQRARTIDQRGRVCCTRENVIDRLRNGVERHHCAILAPESCGIHPPDRKSVV